MQDGRYSRTRNRTCNHGKCKLAHRSDGVRSEPQAGTFQPPICHRRDERAEAEPRRRMEGSYRTSAQRGRGKRSVRGRRFRGWRFRRDRGAGPLADGRLSQEQVRQHPISVGRSRGSAGAKYSGKQPCGDLPPSIRARRAACAHAGKRRHGQPHLPRCRHRDLRMA